MTKADKASTGEQKDVEMGIVSGSQASTSKQGFEDVKVGIVNRSEASTPKQVIEDVEMGIVSGSQASTSKQGFEDVKMGMVNGSESSTSKQVIEDVEMGIGSGSQGHSLSIDKEKHIWVKFIEESLEENTHSRKADTESSCIHRVPEGFRTITNEAYEPCLISIGPYHRGNAKLKSMEKRKWECLGDILNRSKESRLRLDQSEVSQLNHDRRKEILSKCFDVLKSLEKEAKSLYSGNIHLESKDFMEMMLLDGCFIVDYFRRPSHYIPNTGTWMKRQINNDLLLLENKLPLNVLTHIYALVREEEEKEEFLDHAMKFCILVGGKTTTLSVTMLSRRKFQHLLHFYHSYLFYDEIKRANQPIVSEIRTIHTASFLEKAGIKFKEEKVFDKVINVVFEDGDMKITPLVIDAFTISQYRNLIAFEKFHPSIEPRFTAFAQFMVYIINTSEDVILLRERGIIEHALGSDQEVVNVFNQLTTGTFDYLTSGLVKVYKGADRYCKKKSNKLLAKLAVTSLVVGTVILLFGVLQAFFTVFNYIKRRSFGH